MAAALPMPSTIHSMALSTPNLVPAALLCVHAAIYVALRLAAFVHNAESDSTSGTCHSRSTNAGVRNGRRHRGHAHRGPRSLPLRSPERVVTGEEMKQTEYTQSSMLGF